MNIWLIVFVCVLVFLMVSGQSTEHMDNTSLAQAVANFLKANPNINFVGYANFLMTNKNTYTQLADLNNFKILKGLGTGITESDVKKYMTS